MDAGAAKEAAAGAPRDKPPAKKKRWADEDKGARGPSPAAPREDAGKGAALAECAVSCCLFCACLPFAVLCCVARAPARAARRCWGLRSRSRRGPARRLAPGGSSSFSDAELGDFRQGRRRAMADEKDDRGRSPSPRSDRTAPTPAHPPQQPPHQDRGRS